MSETNILDNKAPINPFMPNGLFCFSLWTDSFPIEGVSGLFLHYQLSQLRPFFMARPSCGYLSGSTHPWHFSFTLRKHTYSNILIISSPKTETFQIKILICFHISARNIDCVCLLEPPPLGGSNEYPQSMLLFFFFIRNKKINVYPCKPQFYHMKVGFKGLKTI